MLVKRKSYDDYGGLQAYLDAPEIKAQHKNKGYQDLLDYMDEGAAFLRDLFNVKSSSTIYRWLARLEEENSDGS